MDIQEFNRIKIEITSFVRDENEAKKLYLAFSILADFYLGLTDGITYNQYLELCKILKDEWSDQEPPEPCYE